MTKNSKRKQMYSSKVEVKLIQKTIAARLYKLSRIVRRMERDTSGPLASSAMKLYAWEIQVVATDLHDEFERLQKMLLDAVGEISSPSYWEYTEKFKDARYCDSIAGFVHAFNSH